MTNWIWNPFTGNLDGCGGDGALDFVIKQKRLIWDTDTDWNKGTLGTDVEVVGSGAAAEIAPKTIVIPGPEIYLTWHLNESSGTTAADSSGNERDGALVTPEGGLPAQWVPVKLGNGLSNVWEAEATDYIDGGDIAAFDWDDSFSIELWFKTQPFDMSICGNFEAVEGKGWWLCVQEGYLRFSMIADGENYFQTYTTATMTPGTIYHIVVTYGGSGLAAGVNFYIDSVSAGNSPYYDGLNQMSIIPTVNSFHAGAITPLGCIGDIDEFNIYTVVLSQANVDFRYNAGAGTETPVFTQDTYPTTAQYLTNIADSKIAGQYWGAFNFGRTVPTGTTVTVKVRVSDDYAAMGSYGAALAPGDIIGLNGQFIQFSVDFTGTTTTRAMVDYVSSLFVAPDVVDVSP